MDALKGKTIHVKKIFLERRDVRVRRTRLTNLPLVLKISRLIKWGANSLSMVIDPHQGSNNILPDPGLPLGLVT